MLLSIALPRVPFFWAFIITATLMLYYGVAAGALNGYITLMFYMLIALFAICMREVVVKHSDRMWSYWLLIALATIATAMWAMAIL